MRVLFVCGKNRRRSPTAEAVFRAVDGVEADSAGVRADSDTVVTAEQIEWAELIVVMEKQYGSVASSRSTSRTTGSSWTTDSSRCSSDA